MAKQGVEAEKKMAKEMMEAGRPKNVKEMFGGGKKNSAAAKESLLELGAAVEDHPEVQFPRAKDMKAMARQGAEAEKKMVEEMAERFSPENMKAMAKQGAEAEKKMAEEMKEAGRPKNMKAMAKQGVEAEKKMAEEMKEAGRPQNMKAMAKQGV